MDAGTTTDFVSTLIGHAHKRWQILPLTLKYKCLSVLVDGLVY